MANHAAVTIPLENIRRIQIYINSSPRKTKTAIKKETGADYILNGTLYNMQTGAVNCHLKVDGKVIAAPAYTVAGYAWNEGSDIAMDTLPNAYVKNYIACTPLIVSGKKLSKLTYDAGQGGKRGRSAIGIKQGRLGLYCTKDGTSAARTPEQLRDDLFNAGWESAVMLDGGGSSQCDFAGATVYSSRLVQHYILVFLKGQDDTTDPKEATPMTEQQLRETVANQMKNWVGCKESDGSHKKIIDIYNAHKPLARGYKVKYTDEWCATTVSAAFIKAGLTDIAPTECSCSRMIELYKKLGRWKEADSYVPKIGDVIMYDWQDKGTGDNTGAPDHVGIVVAVNGASLTIVEGNKSEAVAYRAMTVNGRYIRGYCVPDYASKATTTQVSASAIKIASAKSFNRAYAKEYTVTASALNMRSGAGTDKPVIKSLANGAKVTCYGYYTQVDATVWLYVKDQTGALGYCSKKYLK